MGSSFAIYLICLALRLVLPSMIGNRLSAHVFRESAVIDTDGSMT